MGEITIFDSICELHIVTIFIFEKVFEVWARARCIESSKILKKSHLMIISTTYSRLCPTG